MKKLSHLKKILLAFILMAGLSVPAIAQKEVVKVNEKNPHPEDAELVQSRIPDFPLPPPPAIGLDEEKHSDLLKLYPNPNQGRFTIAMDKLGGKEIMITNLVGQEVYHQKVPAYEHELQIDITNLKTGFYFLKVDRKVLRFRKL